MFSQELLDSLREKNIARLFPVDKEVNRERITTSIFLACLSVVKGYATDVMASVDEKVGVRTTIECFTEVVLENEKGEEYRPDGMIVLRNGKKIWTALIEAKVGNNDLKKDQITRYLELAKNKNIDAVITISNQFARPKHHPIKKILKTLTRNVDLFHWSWTSLRTEAELQLKVEEKIAPEQKYILKEMIRYFAHPVSGIKTFDRMNKDWNTVCSKVKKQEHLRKNSDEVINTIDDWHQEQRDISFLLSRKLSTPVTIKLSRNHKNDPERRIADDAKYLCKNESLICEFIIPDAPSLFVEASLRYRTVKCSMVLSAPTDKKRAKGRVNWLIRQFIKAEFGNLKPEDINIEAKWPGRAKATTKTLSELVENPECIQPENSTLAPHRFVVQTNLSLGVKFSSQKNFIKELEKAVTDYYQTVGENMTPWVRPPPKFETKPEIDLSEAEEEAEEQAFEAAVKAAE